MKPTLDQLQVYIGLDWRERRAWDVCERSLQGHLRTPVTVHAISRHTLGSRLYSRRTEYHQGRLWDAISDAPMATDFSLARFWVPLVAGRVGWALYVDCDFLFRAPLSELLEHADPGLAVQRVALDYSPREHTKMDGQLQTRYPHKGESSLMLFNLQMAACNALSPVYLNKASGLDLHGFDWCRGSLGALPAAWNVMDGAGPAPAHADVRAYHFTRGTPDMHRDRGELPFGQEWLHWLTRAEQKAVTAEWLKQDLERCKPQDSVTA